MDICPLPGDEYYWSCMGIGKPDLISAGAGHDIAPGSMVGPSLTLHWTPVTPVRGLRRLYHIIGMTSL